MTQIQVEEVEKKEEFLIIHIDKETKKITNYYCHLIERSTLEGLATAYNKNEKNKDYTKIYDDPIIVQLVEDARNSYSNKNLADRLHRFTSDMEDLISEFKCLNEDLDDKLKELEKKS